HVTERAAGEELDRVGASRRAVESARDECVSAGRGERYENRVVLQAVGPRIGIAAVVTRRPVGVQVDPDSLVGVDGIAAEGIAGTGAGLRGNAVAVIERDPIGRFRSRAADGVARGAGGE